MKTVKRLLERFYLPILLVLAIVFFSVFSDAFFTVSNLINIFVQNAYLIIATIGIAIIMISGGADLSVSYQMGLVSVFTGKLLMDYQMHTFFVVVLGLMMGVLLGFINGFVTIKLNVHPMVTTLATMTIYQGVAFVLSGANTFYNFSDSFKAIGQKYIGGFLPICVIIMIVSVVVIYYIMNKTYFGRYIYAIGGNEEAARLAGINTIKVRILAFVVAGIFVSLASIVLTARTGTGSASIATDAVFTCFSACVLGGISFRGGEGNLLGVVFGVLIYGVLSNGMQMIGLSIYSQYIVKGIILVLAIAFDNYQKSKRLADVD